MVTSYIVKSDTGSSAFDVGCSAFQCSVFRIRRSMFLNSLFPVRQWRTRLCEPDVWPVPARSPSTANFSC